MSTLGPAGAAIAMAVVHFFAGRLRFLSGTPRSRWLSAAGGISVAYVMVHLLPEIAEYQEAVRTAAGGLLASVERHVYVLALVGLVAFYGAEAASRAERRGRSTTGDGDSVRTLSGAALFSFTMYALYNATIGYLLVHREDDLALFAVAMGLHFLVTDFGLRANHGDAYHRFGRWILSAVVVAGAVVGYVAQVPEAMVGILIAFIGGGTILNVLKEELPEERDSRFGAFVAGVALYTAVLLAA